MVDPKIQSQQIKQSDLLKNKKVTSGMPKTTKPAEFSTLSSRLSGGSQTAKFGSLSDGKLASNLEKTASSSPETETPKNETKTEVSGKSENITVFEQNTLKASLRSFDKDTRNLGSLLSAKSAGVTGGTADSFVRSSGQTTTNTSTTHTSYAKGWIGEAQAQKANADACAASGDWQGAYNAYTKAQNALNQASKELQNAQSKGENGVEGVSQQISSLSQQYSNMQNWLSGKISLNSALSGSTYTGGTTGTAEEATPGIGQQLWQGVLDGSAANTLGSLNNLLGGGNAQNAQGGQSTSGSSSAGNAGQTLSSGFNGIANGFKATGNFVSNALSSSKELKYDKAYESNVSEAKGKFDAASAKEAIQGKIVTDKNAELKSIDAELSQLDSDINKINGETETYLEDYKTAKAALAENEQAINKQDAIIKAQTDVKSGYETQLSTKKEEQERQTANVSNIKNKKLPSAEQALSTAESAVSTQKDVVANKNSAVSAAESALSSATAENEGNLKNKLEKAKSDLTQAKADLVTKERELKEKEQDLKNKKAELKKAEATLTKLNEDIKIIKAASEKAGEAIATAKNEKGVLKKQTEALQNTADAKLAALKTAEGDAKKLRDKIATTYNKQTKETKDRDTAQATIAACKSEKDVAQGMADNAVAEAKSHKESDEDAKKPSFSERFRSLF